MINIAICDDDDDIINSIKSAISDYSTSHAIEFEVHSFKCGEKLLESKLNFDLVFLDIEMSGIDGLKTAQLFRQIDRRARIVYVTNHSEFGNLILDNELSVILSAMDIIFVLLKSKFVKLFS